MLSLRGSIKGVEAWDPERLAQHAICGNCGHTGHLLVDCAFPDDSGFISGCPVCNTKLHNANDCLRVQPLSPRDLVSFIIVRRGNKPPLRCRDPWGPLPWTIAFTRDMIKGTERDKVWLEHHYFAGDYQTLPEDSTTGSDIDGAAANDDLLSQCHKLNKDID
uniref:CCHC-type domain-containing protein n=1 Tax=Colletotrichum fructicola (strain Nara gc5) TaxID=1213859 RepID=L2FVT4_COLFN